MTMESGKTRNDEEMKNDIIETWKELLIQVLLPLMT